MKLLLFILLFALVNPQGFKVSSPAFDSNSSIPLKYTCEGENINPELVFKNMPSRTKSYVIIVSDPDAKDGIFYHWVVWDIPPVGLIPENSSLGIQGQNSSGKWGYMGPCPPKGQHRYFFKIYALDKMLELDAGSSREQLEQAMSKHVLAKTELIGRYRKAN